MIIRGGENIYPKEIETVLYSNDAVLEAAVVGQADDVLGEGVVAYFSGRPGAPVTVWERRPLCLGPARGDCHGRGARGAVRRAARQVQAPGGDRAPRRAPQESRRQDRQAGAQEGSCDRGRTPVKLRVTAQGLIGEDAERARWVRLPGSEDLLSFLAGGDETGGRAEAGMASAPQADPSAALLPFHPR